MASQTLLMFGEGLAEEMFLKYLRGLYAHDTGVAVTIRNGKGGNAVDIINNAVNEPGAFDRRVVVLDNDKGQQEMNLARIRAKKKGVELLENTPCLEAVLLSILNNGQRFSSKTSSWCKSEFESKYLNKKKRSDLNEYQKVFPKTLLDSHRGDVVELGKFISLMATW